MHNSIGRHDITLSDSSVPDQGPTIAIDSEALLVDRLDGADERPVRWHKCSAAEHVWAKGRMDMECDMCCVNHLINIYLAKCET